VISGYLIASHSLRRWGRLAAIDLRAFWLRRAARILPCPVLLAALHALGAADYVIHRDGQSRGRRGARPAPQLVRRSHRLPAGRLGRAVVAVDPLDSHDHSTHVGVAEPLLALQEFHVLRHLVKGSRGRGVGALSSMTTKHPVTSRGHPRAQPTSHTVGTVPPSMTYSVPVIEPALGETTNAMRSATSCGFAGRPMGMPPNARMMICLPPS